MPTKNMAIIKLFLCYVHCLACWPKLQTCCPVISYLYVLIFGGSKLMTSKNMRLFHKYGSLVNMQQREQKCCDFNGWSGVLLIIFLSHEHKVVLLLLSPVLILLLPTKTYLSDGSWCTAGLPDIFFKWIKSSNSQ